MLIGYNDLKLIMYVWYSMKSNKLDTSSELQVFRFCDGIKLIEPNSKNSGIHSGWYTNHTVATLLKFPCSIYFDNANGVIQQLNDHNIELCGLDSTHQAIGKTYFNRFTSKAASLLLKNDHDVMKNEKLKIFEEDVQINNNDVNQVLSIKMPWYNNQNKVIGLFGCSIILGKDSLANSLALVAKIGLFIPVENLSRHIGFEMNGIYLSKQQRICARFLLAGMSTKEIALRMKLSPRTVENYIDNLKSKLKCHNKTELIIKLYKIMSAFPQSLV